jgi:hypothetical protein
MQEEKEMVNQRRKSQETLSIISGPTGSCFNHREDSMAIIDTVADQNLK